MVDQTLGSKKSNIQCEQISQMIVRSIASMAGGGRGRERGGGRREAGGERRHTRSPTIPGTGT